jgi:hypothetical protein
LELKLKDGWGDYFLSGLAAGVVLAIAMVLCVYQDMSVNEVLTWVFLLVVSLLFSIWSFISGSKVKRA